jgi:primosomal protein N'
MYLVNCLPFSKALNRDSLTYFSPDFLEPGSLVKISIRGKSTSALILDIRSVRDAKSEIRGADYKIKKIISLSSKPFLNKSFLDAVIKTSDYYATSAGAVLSQIIPSAILENPNLLSNFLIKQNNKTKIEVNGVKLALQDQKEERISYYKSLIREEFAKKKSIFICVPQNEDVKQIKEKIERGIEQYICAFHKDMTKKTFKEEWKKLSAQKHPLVIVGTARWLFIPREDLSTIIIERETSNGWKTMVRPFIDLRTFAENYAEERKIRIIFADTFLRIETLYRNKNEEVQKFEQVKWRLEMKDEIVIVNPTEIKNKTKEFNAISKITADSIKRALENGFSVFIYTTRKGLSPITLCGDCGQYVECANCSSPMILYKGKSGGVFRCHQCGESRDASETCKKCGSWKLIDLGIGAEKVTDEITKLFPNTQIFQLNKDVATTNLKAEKIVDNFYSTRGSILIGTDMAFSYLYKKIGVTIIASLDSLFSIPDFRIREKIFNIMIQARNLSKNLLLIQTRNPDDISIKSIVSGNLIEFYNVEIQDRKLLEYPPFGVFIKITIRGNSTSIKKESVYLKKNLDKLQNLDISFFPSNHEKKGEQSAINAVIKVSKENWPNDELVNFLKFLPSYYEIKVDPDNLL